MAFAALPITSDHFTLAEGSSPRSTATTTGGSLCFSSPSVARPLPSHTTMWTVPSLTWCSYSLGFLLSATSMLQQQVFPCSSIRLVVPWHPKLVRTAISEFHWSSCLESTRLPVKFFRVAIRWPSDHWSYGFLFLKSKFTMVHNELNYVSSVSLSNLRFP